MKVLFYGNHLKHYYLAKWLRSWGHECDLYLLDRNNPSSLPEWSDPSVSGNYPEWVHERYRGRSIIARLSRRLGNFGWLPMAWVPRLNPRDFAPPRDVKQAARGYDLAFTSGRGNIIPALGLDVPVVFRAVGSDMSKLPFESGSPYFEALSYAFRRRVRKVASIVAYQEDTVWSARFLGVFDRLRYFSVPTDVHAMDAAVDTQLRDELNERYAAYDCVYFLPSRKILDPNNPAYKGSEKVLRAFARLVAEHPNVRLLSIAAGGQEAEYRRLVGELGLTESCEEVTGFSDAYNYLPMPQLSAYVQMDNAVVLNDFGYTKTHLTGIARETLSLGGVLMDGVDPTAAHFLNLYAEGCPMLPAETEEAIYQQLKATLEMGPPGRSALRAKAKEWALSNLHWENTLERLVGILEEAAGGRVESKPIGAASGGPGDE